jgi:hypothetical protein
MAGDLMRFADRAQHGRFANTAFFHAGASRGKSAADI